MVAPRSLGICPLLSYSLVESFTIVTYTKFLTSAAVAQDGWSKDISSNGYSNGVLVTQAIYSSSIVVRCQIPSGRTKVL